MAMITAIQPDSPHTRQHHSIAGRNSSPATNTGSRISASLNQGSCGPFFFGKNVSCDRRASAVKPRWFVVLRKLHSVADHGRGVILIASVASSRITSSTMKRLALNSSSPHMERNSRG